MLTLVRLWAIVQLGDEFRLLNLLFLANNKIQINPSVQV